MTATTVERIEKGDNDVSKCVSTDNEMGRRRRWDEE
ncbi:hypothetical protein L195_g060757 [Trifolium pratense]|uniref:Uncharacterized protein n=1 Tax=Trifolium pratense TaxID=57577 RepID=A0A2K3K5V3_TRIPR|nr:hypothetical protein L195_g060757 [Trifolium pratense]